jgi:hypothetical protein
VTKSNEESRSFQGAAEVLDPDAERLGRVPAHYARPEKWHCVFCGHLEDQGMANTYLCASCGHVRPFAARGATMVGCRRCGQWSIGIAKYCEWCGNQFGRPNLSESGAQSQGGSDDGISS